MSPNRQQTQNPRMAETVADPRRRVVQEGLISKVSEIDSMRQFTTKYSLAEAMEKIVRLVGKEAS